MRLSDLSNVKQRIKGRAEIREPKNLNIFHDITVSHCVPQNNLFMNSSLLCLFTGANDPGFSRTAPAVIPTANHAT